MLEASGPRRNAEIVCNVQAPFGFGRRGGICGAAADSTMATHRHRRGDLQLTPRRSERHDRYPGSGALALGRFAPTPSGPLHFGSMMTALASWLFAKADGGAWLVRIEDLDAPRVIEKCAEEQIRLLALCGLESDGPVVRQSDRTALYDAPFRRLAALGRLYPCRCSRKEIATSASAPHGSGEPVYPGTCRDANVDPAEARAWRFRVDEGDVEFVDEVFGRMRQDVAREVGDFVVRREQPSPAYAYQFAVVVDDAEQGMTQVVRGADLLDSTPRQILLGRTLGLPALRYAHVPVLVSALGEKLSKRAGSRQLAEAAARGRLPDITAALLTTLGQEPALDGALARFDPSRIPRRREVRLTPPP
jgi:glutamyl-Q tRNA(Asp) synthetase